MIKNLSYGNSHKACEDVLDNHQYKMFVIHHTTEHNIKTNIGLYVLIGKSLQDYLLIRYTFFKIRE